MRFNADEALTRFIAALPKGARVLDIGCGGNVKAMLHTPKMRQVGLDVVALDQGSPKADVQMDFQHYAEQTAGGLFDGIWASHVLEHVENVGEFLKACRRLCKPAGLFAVTVPPANHINGEKLVPGHLSLWTPALLCYNLIVAGWDLSEASMATYGKNISVVTRRVDAKLPKLLSCRGDIEKLAQFFPCEVSHGCDAWLPNTRW